MIINKENEETMNWNFKTLIDNAIESFEDAIEEEKTAGNDIEFCDLIHEIADSKVPVMTWDILQYAAHNLTLATEPTEIKAFNGDDTGVNCIAGRMYEILCEKLTDNLENKEN